MELVHAGHAPAALVLNEPDAILLLGLIVAREMGVPAIVGCGDATEKVENGDEITISCCEGDTGVI